MMSIVAASDVDVVALWIGLIAGVVSIVLAVVAIWFTVLVDKRSRDVSSVTIQSLQRIDSAVGRISADTAGLIRAAWDKLLGSVGGAGIAALDQETIRSIASGLAAELRADLAADERKDGEEVGERTAGDSDRDITAERLTAMDEAINRLERSLESQLVSVANREPQGGEAAALDVFRRLSPTARALVRALVESRSHLTRSEYLQLRRTPLREQLAELRGAGLLTPLAATGDASGRPQVVYWVPGSRLGLVGSGLLLAPPEPAVVTDRVRTALERIGYAERIRTRRLDREGGKD